MAIVNGKAYDWGDIDVQISGVNLELQEISYDDELEKEAVYGMGHMPRGYGSGNYKASGKLSLLRDDYNDLNDYCKSKGITFFDLVIPKIVVSYGNDNQKIVTDVLHNVTFTKRSGGGKQGDKSLTVDLDMLIFGKIVRDGVEPVKVK